MDYKQYTAQVIAKAVDMDEAAVLPLLETPPEAAMGDLAFPCFTLAKTLRKAPPMIASELAAKIEKGEAFEKVEANGPYLNFFFQREGYISGIVEEVLEKGEDYGKLDIGKGKTVIVEFSSPNIAKPFHIGHLFSTSVGNSLSKIYKNLGYTVERINHLGDWGTQFGKLISAYKRWGNKDVIEKDPIAELLKIYVKFHQEAEKEPALEDEARAYFKQLEDGDEEVTALWQYFRDVSLKEFNKTYETLGVSFDSFNGEAFYSDKMDIVVDTLREKNLLVESENAQVVLLEEENLLPCMILKSDGATIYATRDLAAAIYRKNTYDFYKNIYVVGLPQALHFKQIFAVLRKMGYAWAEDCKHVGFGTVKFPDRKLSTRNGDVVLLDEVLSEAVQKTAAKVEESNPDLENKEEVSKKIGIGAVIYTFLKNSREKDIVFSWEDMLDFEGESAPYVQYGYARGKSVLRKAGETEFSHVDYTKCTSDEEYALAKLLGAFASVTADAAEKNEPFYVTRYVTNVARAFNKFYNTLTILKADEDTKKARLALTKATCQVIKNALALLGIDVVESM